MPSINKIIIAGHLGQDPEVKTINSGQSVANFSVATSEKWTDKNGEAQERTEWHRVVVWGKSAENCGKYLKKGSAVLVEGKNQTRKWEAEDGTNRYTTEVIANNVQFLGRAAAREDTHSVEEREVSEMVPKENGFDSGEALPF